MRLNKRLLLALALAALLVAPAFHCKEDPEEVELEAEDDPYEDGEEDEGPAKADDAKGDADESAVVVVTDKNVDEVLGKAKFALVSALCGSSPYTQHLCPRSSIGSARALAWRWPARAGAPGLHAL